MDDQALCDGNEYLDLAEGEVLINEGEREMRLTAL